MLFNTHSPETLDFLDLAVVMPLVAVRRVDLGDAKCEEGKREELECVFGCLTVCDFGEEGVLGSRFDVGGGLEGADGTFH